MALQDITQGIQVSTPIRQSRDWSMLSKTIDSMNEKHIKGAEQATAIETYIANLDLNPKEDQWKTDYAQRINDRINENVDASGYYGNSLASTIRLSAEIAKDPALNGRVKAQKERKEWEDNIQRGVAQGLYSQEVADMIIEQNPYTYDDKYEGETDEVAIRNRAQEKLYGTTGNEGRIIGGVFGKYATPVRSVPLTEIFDMALKFVKDERGQYEYVTYLDANGNETRDIDSSADGIWYAKRGGTYQKLSEDKIEEAINAVIAANPAYAASLKQDYDVESWKYRKSSNDVAVGGIFIGEIGVPRSFKNYVSNRIRSLAGISSYNYTTSSVDMNTKAQELAAARRNNALAAAGANDLYTGSSLTSSSNIAFQVDISQEPINAKNAFTTAKARMLALTDNDSNMVAYFDGNITFDEAIRSYNDATQYELRKLRREYEDNYEFYNRISEGATDKDKDAIDFLSNIASFDYTTNTNNEYSREIAQILSGQRPAESRVDTGILYLHSIFPEENRNFVITDTDKIRFTYDDNSSFIEAMGGIENSYIRTINGKEYLEIPMSDFETITRAAKVLAVRSGFFNRGVEIIDKDGNQKGDGYTGRQRLNAIGGIIGRAEQQQNNYFTKKGFNPTAVISNPNLPGRDFAEIEYRLARDRGLIDIQSYNSFEKDLIADIEASIMGNDYVNNEVYLQDNNDDPYSLMSKVTSTTDRRDLFIRAQRAMSEGNISYRAASNPYSPHGYGTNITVTHKSYNKDETEPGFTIYVDGLLKNEAARRYADDTSVRARQIIERRTSTNTPYSIYNTGTDLDGLKIRYAGNQQYILTDGNSKRLISKTEAINIVDANLALEAAKDAWDSKQTNANGVLAVIRAAAPLLGYDFDQVAGNMYYSITGNVLYLNEDNE